MPESDWSDWDPHDRDTLPTLIAAVDRLEKENAELRVTNELAAILRDELERAKREVCDLAAERDQLLGQRNYLLTTFGINEPRMIDDWTVEGVDGDFETLEEAAIACVQSDNEEKGDLAAERDQLRAERDQGRETNRELHRRVQRAEADAEARTKKKLNWERVSFVLSCFDYVEAQLRDAQALRFPMSWHGHALLAVLRSQIVEAQEFLSGAWIGDNVSLNDWFERTSRELLPLDPPAANKVCGLLREAVDLIQLELYHHPNQVRQDQVRSLVKRTWDLIEAENLRHLMSDLLPEVADGGR